MNGFPKVIVTGTIIETEENPQSEHVQKPASLLCFGAADLESLGTRTLQWVTLHRQIL